MGADFVGQRNPFELSSHDTTTIVAYTTLHDSVSTKNLSFYILGDLNDPEIGSTKASIFTQYALPKDQFDFGTSPKIDSIVLQLPYAYPTGYHGFPDMPQQISVYELTEDLSFASDSFYYSNRGYSYSPILIGQYNRSFSSINDTLTFQMGSQSVTILPHVRIRLDNISSVLKDRFSDPLATPSGYFKTTEDFQKVFKGLAIVPTLSDNPGEFPNGPGCLTYLNLRSTNCSVVVYYNDSLKAEFPIFQNSVHTNKYTHHYAPGLNIQPYCSTVHSDVNYLQPTTGLKTRITFPYLYDYIKGQKISVTGAELVLTVKSGTTYNQDSLPHNLRLLASDSLGRNDFILDEFIGTQYFGGTLENGNTYRFNIVRQLQHYINELQNNNRNSNFGLNLIVTADNPITGKRVILDTRRGTSSFKLNFTYAVIK